MTKNLRRNRPPTPESLSKAALTYLGRFAASEASLRRVLENRIRRSGLRDPEMQAELHCIIEKIVEKHRKTGVLNDVAYAETKVNSLRRAGRSARAISQKLGQAGVDRQIVARALAESDDAGEEDGEIRAARELVRRRKLGPFRAGGKADPARARKDLATLARAGFAIGIARRVLETQWVGDTNEGDPTGDGS